ncbi:MAG: BolA family transcriptional regulator [Rickettsiaceae bacterium]|nr:BolA family transcriptional regulator [Rickettsiaceae bacterium]
MSRKKIIADKLATLKPHILEIIDESSLHSGHASSPNLPETHFKVTLSANILKSKSKLQQHRVINQLLKDEFDNGLHALSITII